MRRLVVEGWRFLPHSYSLVNQFQCLELASRGDIALFHRDAPFCVQDWRQCAGLLSPQREALLRAIPPPPPDLRPDALYRIAFPYELKPAAVARTVVFGTTEFSNVQSPMFVGASDVKQALSSLASIIVTPSEWSRQGFLRGGAPPDNVVVVPHGVDCSIFHPIPDADRAEIRRGLGWEGRFVLLHVGAMTWNKGIDVLLRAFALFAVSNPDALLALKGANALFSSEHRLRQMLGELNNQQREALSRRIFYVGDTMSLADIARLHKAADVYVAPYRGEGFNLPVLEAAACGLPAICTDGGPTDAFTRPQFALRIPSSISEDGETGDRMLEPDPERLLALLAQAKESADWRRGAVTAGPEFVRANFTWKHAVDKLIAVLFPA